MGRNTSKLVVGLGNPGPEYQGTRHNVGFEVLDRLASQEGTLFDPQSILHTSDGDTVEVSALLAHASPLGPTDSVAAGEAGPWNALFLKPQTFMNLSGKAVRPVVEEAQLEPDQVLVVFDDMDLPAGKLRIRPFGGAGGQKGMASIIRFLETDRFPRLRVGIGRPETDAARHVLSVFDSEERLKIDEALDEAVLAIRFWLRGNSTEACMTRFHSRWNRGPEGPAPLQGER